MKRVNVVREEPPTHLTNSIVRVKIVRYGICLKNHSIHRGGFVMDGCQEFIANGEEGSDGATKCAACGCHRDHHNRIERESEVECETNEA
ncbi:hypothetical protein Lal_00040376 [Lupinus albus]|uniref:Putative transcription factor ZF-HD family n=1 Tax=Lupinus albus TaxID=3870 RepID=A0A6A4QZS2_LUPAL|nr:putative transcription factor ZF-HD family [Lupinus albus]KAE9619943.1 putative transcription factor ZF-HD family [Lupinus albus]KAF1877435.1 hypothetical protein Lal_00040150 [Lupinus albus]KAF1877658.1 hypothetical protein Lal_00040376 [Lupinus albus]